MSDNLQDKKNTPLVDTTECGKDRRWGERKTQSLALSKAFRDCFVDTMIAEGWTREQAETLADDYHVNTTWITKHRATERCGETLWFTRDADNRLKLWQAWFCKDRLCPMCNWRRALKYTAQVGQILQVMMERKITGKPIFATFTMRNVKGEDINQSFSDFADSFRRLMAYKAVKTYCVGAIRTSEITYNAKSDTYNTHIHCLMWMSARYYKTSGAYLSQAKWTELWQRAARLDYTPVVNVKAVKPRTPTDRDPTGLFGAVLETAKYPIKPDAFRDLTTQIWQETDSQRQARLERIKHLERGMYRKRLISFFGVFKDIRKELQLDDPEDDDLVHIETDETPTTAVACDRYEYDPKRHDYYWVEREALVDGVLRDWHNVRG